MITFSRCTLMIIRSYISLKKTLYTILFIWLIISLAACSIPSEVAPPTIQVEEVTPTSALVTPEVPVNISFSDPILEALVRGTMGKTEGEITLAEAQAVTRMNLSNELEGYITEVTPITDLRGLENFTSLEILDLSDHAVTDIAPLQGLTKLTSLSLAGNPVSDVSPLAGLTNLQLLILSGSQASDYSSLSSLVNLQVLLLDNSTITDLSPLAGLINLRGLFLAQTSVDDMSQIETIYQNLEQKDFVIPSTLEELGFRLDTNSHQAYYDSEDASFTINHTAWGPAQFEWDENIIRTSAYLEGDYKVSVGYYGVHKAYVCFMVKDGEELMNYVYNTIDGSNNLGEEHRPSVEQAIRAAFDVMEGEDALLAPVRFFDEIVKKTFNMSAEKLFALPYEPPTLKNLGFFPDKPNAVCLYEQRGGRDYNIEIHRPEWGEKEFDIRFFTPLSDEYRVVITYNFAERKVSVGADDNYAGGASFDYFFETDEYVDIWCSNNEMTVEEYFVNAYNDPQIEDVYVHTLELFQQYFIDTFGMTFEELYALSTCE